MLSHPMTTEPDYTDAERQFMLALDRYKRVNDRPYPTCREVLAVLVSLGYRQVAPAEPLPGFVRQPNRRVD